jgi:hypothetical protein
MSTVEHNFPMCLANAKDGTASNQLLNVYDISFSILEKQK